ncbi:MAG: hypothetical protein BSOLF_1360 [Candidatus Carbobacillus altaicus]|uniref:Uncharacterized protein n=1 Tax=Candidatus Carbonibacillus altaicus TaxID=2163959 RepID=A0A2R6Y4A4_9BACL|nr:MAG: hypothetical protein BSOLF_1360 [Candidatus Carbobacillus altaicus]
MIHVPSIHLTSLPHAHLICRTRDIIRSNDTFIVFCPRIPHA